MSSPRILVLGEALIDQFADSSVVGGAPLNLARHASSLLSSAAGAVRFVSRVGNDVLGEEIKAQAIDHGLAAEWIQTDTIRSTGVVNVAVDSCGKPSYKIPYPVAWDAIEPPLLDGFALDRQTLVCYGTLALRSQASRTAILSTVDQLHMCTRFVDLNLRTSGPGAEVIEAVLRRTDWLKLNDEELSFLTKALSLPPSPLHAVGALHRRYGIDLTVVTRGASGCWAFETNNSGDGVGLVADLPGASLERMVDSVGAGDAFSAAWLVSQVLGADLQRSLRVANAYAAAVCGYRGPVPPSAHRHGFYHHWQSRLQGGLHTLGSLPLTALNQST